MPVLLPLWILPQRRRLPVPTCARRGAAPAMRTLRSRILSIGPSLREAARAPPAVHVLPRRLLSRWQGLCQCAPAMDGEFAAPYSADREDRGGTGARASPHTRGTRAGERARARVAERAWARRWFHAWTIPWARKGLAWTTPGTFAFLGVLGVCFVFCTGGLLPDSRYPISVPAVPRGHSTRLLLCSNSRCIYLLYLGLIIRRHPHRLECR